MKIRSLVAAANIGFTFLLVSGNAAESAELKVLSAGGIQAVMEDLGPKFERATGHKLAITFANAGTTVKVSKMAKLPMWSSLLSLGSRAL